ncbi:hypothetical protein ALQ87_200048 [Pseudomonas savastanoi pv. glycinea]|nr:hypothetical protein ALQ87_200048 [Pseudomonas savastanoi pv. glycinea]
MMVRDISASCGLLAMPALIAMSRTIAPKSALTFVGIAKAPAATTACPTELLTVSRPSLICRRPLACNSAERAVRPISL